MYSDIMRREKTKTLDLLRQYGSDYRVILVGDADMAPSELLNIDGAIYYYYRNDTPGIHWLKMVKDHFRKCVWLNPRPARIWPHTDTIPIVKEVFPMYELTLEGITDAVKYLMR
jgi:uncharacterized protein with von Willebrand factor type A (vWA) domain